MVRVRSAMCTIIVAQLQKCAVASQTELPHRNRIVRKLFWKTADIQLWNGGVAHIERHHCMRECRRPKAVLGYKNRLAILIDMKGAAAPFNRPRTHYESGCSAFVHIRMFGWWMLQYNHTQLICICIAHETLSTTTLHVCMYVCVVWCDVVDRIYKP